MLKLLKSVVALPGEQEANRAMDLMQMLLHCQTFKEVETTHHYNGLMFWNDVIGPMVR